MEEKVDKYDKSDKDDKCDKDDNLSMTSVTRMMSPDSVWREHSTKTLARIGEDKLRDTIN